MKRITMHLSGAKQITVERKVVRNNGGFDYVKKKICYNTVTQTVNSEDEGIVYMNHYLENHKGVKITKHYFTNLK